MFSTIGSLSLRVRRRQSDDNLFSLIERDAEILIAESGTSLAQDNVTNFWITFKYSVFLEVLRPILKYWSGLRYRLVYRRDTFLTQNIAYC